MAITQGSFDVVFDAIKATLIAYNATQIAADKFTTYADYYRTFPDNDDLANMFLYLGPIASTEKTTESYFQQDVVYYIDLIVNGKGTSSGGRADEAAGVRLRGLIQQGFNALTGSNNFNFGLATGTIGKKDIRVDPLPPDPQMGERVLAAARITLTVSVAWCPDALTGTDLESISIDAGLWTILITEP